jgi:hypothetical protein
MSTTTIKQSIHRENEVPLNPRSKPTSVAISREKRAGSRDIRQEAQPRSRQPRPSSPPAIRSRGDLPTRHIPTPHKQPKVVPQQQYQIVPARTHEQPAFNFSLPVLFLLSGYLVGAALVLMCGLDLLLGVPFSRVSLVFDIGFLFSGAALLYLSWNARDGCRWTNVT